MAHFMCPLLSLLLLLHTALAFSAPCYGSVEDCSSGKDQFQLRRLLQQQGQPQYISYGALGADNVPCPAGSGLSYYTNNCNTATGPSNPYQRGCSTITRCARDTS